MRLFQNVDTKDSWRYYDFFPNCAKDFQRCSDYFWTLLKISKARFDNFLTPKMLNKHPNITFSVILLYYLRQILSYVVGFDEK